MNQETYTVDYFLSFFSQIPEDRWCTDWLTDQDGNHCALGHCGSRVDGTMYRETPASVALHNLFRQRFEKGVAWVNDGQDSRYAQDHPKARILAALWDIKRQQEEQKPAQVNLQQCGVESRHAVSKGLVHGSYKLPSGVERVATPPSTGQPRQVSPSSDGPLLQSSNPVTAALAKLVPCVHLYFAMGDSCSLCGHVKPATVPLKETI